MTRHRGLNGFATVWIFLLLAIVGCGIKGSHQPISHEVKVDSLEKEMQDSLFANPAYSRALLRHALSQAEDSLAHYRLLSMYAKSFFVSSDFDSIRYYNRPVKRWGRMVAPSPQVCDILSEVYNMEGNVWMQLNQPDSAICEYRQAYDYRRQGKRIGLLPDICINLADANVHKGQLDYAASYYRRALFLCDSLALPEHSKFPIYYGLGQTYMDLRDFELSNQYYEMAGRFFPEMNVSEKWIYLNNRGNHFYYKKDYWQALGYMRRALEVVEPYSQMVFERNLTKLNLGELYVLTDNLDSARMCLNEGLRFFSSIQNNSAIYYVETQMIELALREGNTALARQMIERTVPDSHIDANMLNIRNQYLQHYFERTGDYKRAYEYLKRDIELSDSVRNERVRTRVAELDMRYRQDTIVLRKEMQIERQAGEMRVLKLSVYVWILICLLLAVAFGISFWYMRKKREFLRERFLGQINRMRMENIRNRVSPHFTFNVLGREISQFKGPEEKKDGLLQLVQLLRKSLELTEKLNIPLQEELDFVKTYINLEHSRLGEDFSWSLEVEEGIDTTATVIPSMLIQIPVENAIKHGLHGIEGIKTLQVRVKRERQGVKITITDNGRGYLSHTMSETRGTGTGLKVLYQTIQLLNAKNKEEKIEFEIINLANEEQTGTRVSVYIPSYYSYDL